MSGEESRLQAIIDAQGKALMHWRREADRDAGTIARYERALTRIAKLPAAVPGEAAIQIARAELPAEVARG